jgi:hypothetical protein
VLVLVLDPHLPLDTTKLGVPSFPVFSQKNALTIAGQKSSTSTMEDLKIKVSGSDSACRSTKKAGSASGKVSLEEPNAEN